jgi:hypothetical protein
MPVYRPGCTRREPPDVPYHRRVRDLPQRLRGTVAGGVYEGKTLVAQHPWLALPLGRARGHGEIVGGGTDIVIESFPRCASSFAVGAFRLAQEPASVRIANHTHMPAQVMVAARRGIPALVLIREPQEAILSLLIRNPDLGVAGTLRGYLRFFEPLIRYRNGFVVARFQEVVGDFGAVMTRVNERFGTSFVPFLHSPENVERIARDIEEDYRTRSTSDEQLERLVPLPSDARRHLKQDLRRRFTETAPHRLVARADAVYAELTG